MPAGQTHKNLTTFEATCLVAGAGIGGGVMAVPYLAERTGLLPAVAIAIVAYAVTLILHIMVAELSLRTDYSSELLTIFSKHLFRDGARLRSGFYILMAVTLIFNLAAYIAGSGEILSALINIPLIAGKMIFFILAAAVVFFGLKKVAVNEVVSLMIKLLFLAIMAALSFAFYFELSFVPSSAPSFMPSSAPSFSSSFSSSFAPSFAAHGGTPYAMPSPSSALAVYGIIMFSLSSLFAVPQAASGLAHSREKLIRAVVFGLLINLAVIIITTACVLHCSDPVTEVAIVGWAKALGPTVNVLGSLFIFLAMLGAFWSISLQLCDMTGAFFKAGRKLSWLIGTFPCFVVALLPIAGFIDLMQIAGGATAVIVALMVVPAYRNSIRMSPQNDILLGMAGKSRAIALVVTFMYILMAAASFL